MGCPSTTAIDHTPRQLGRATSTQYIMIIQLTCHSLCMEQVMYVTYYSYQFLLYPSTTVASIPQIPSQGLRLRLRLSRAYNLLTFLTSHKLVMYSFAKASKESKFHSNLEYFHSLILVSIVSILNAFGRAKVHTGHKMITINGMQ